MACVACEWTRTPIRALAILGIAGLIGTAHSLRTPIRLELKGAAPEPSIAPAPTGPGQSDPASPREETLGVRITLDQARRLYDSGDADFIDAREPHEFQPGHIPGAYNLTQADFLGGKTPEALEFLDPARRVVIYCGGGECHASENVAILLQQAGFTSIHIMEAGFPMWVEAGYEVEASSADEPEGNG